MKTLFSRLLLAAPAVSSLFLLACAKDNDPAPASKEPLHATFTSRYSGLKDSNRKYFIGESEPGPGLRESGVLDTGIGFGEVVRPPLRYDETERKKLSLR